MKRNQTALAMLALSLTSPAFAQMKSVSEQPQRKAPAPSDELIVHVNLQYSQTGNVWGTVNEVKRAEGSLPAINDILRQRYGKPEEAFSQFKVGASKSGISLFTGAEALAFGLVQNPVVPELHANALLMGAVQAGYEFSMREIGTKLKVGAIAGRGREKRIDAISTDLIDKIPMRTGAVTMVGFDFDATHGFWIDSIYRLEISGGVRETLFETTSPPAALDADGRQSILTHRWKAKAHLSRDIAISGIQKTSVGVEGTAGPQPLPVDVLPRSWDYVHNLYPLPELGAMFGIGLAGKSHFNRSTLLEARAGFYGGYLGGEVAFQWKSARLSAASWGIETSSAYHVLGTREWIASIGFNF